MPSSIRSRACFWKTKRIRYNQLWRRHYFTVHAVQQPSYQFQVRTGRKHRHATIGKDRIYAAGVHATQIVQLEHWYSSKGGRHFRTFRIRSIRFLVNRRRNRYILFRITWMQPHRQLEDQQTVVLVPMTPKRSAIFREHNRIRCAVRDIDKTDISDGIVRSCRVALL